MQSCISAVIVQLWKSFKCTSPIKLVSSARQIIVRLLCRSISTHLKRCLPAWVEMEDGIICRKMEYLIKYGQMSSYMWSGCELDRKEARWMHGLLNETELPAPEH